MTNHDSHRAAQYRIEIERFLSERLTTKLAKLADDDPKRDQEIAKHQREAWIESAAARAKHLHAVTHVAKATHSSAKGSTNEHCPPESLIARDEVGTHAIGSEFRLDVAVDDAKHLDLYGFLALAVDGVSILNGLSTQDATVTVAFADDRVRAEQLAEELRRVFLKGDFASHPLMKQVFWPVEDSAATENQYHLLAPLFASSLAQVVHERINDVRYSEQAKAARKARWAQAAHPHGYADYVHLAVRKLGGTKPQNISQLNSERGGVNYLLGSLPPEWKSRDVAEPWNLDSVFGRFGRRADVRQLLLELRRFLKTDPPENAETRNRVDVYVDALIDALVGFAAQIQAALTTGWTADPRCKLVRCEQLWLDPRRAQSSQSADQPFRTDWDWMDWPQEIGERFGNWLNTQLEKNLPVGSAEKKYWARQLLADGEWAWRIDQDRRGTQAAEVLS